MILVLLNIPRGTEVLIRRLGESEWRTHHTKQTNRFPSAEVTEDGFYLFERKGYQMKVHPDRINRSYIETGPAKNKSGPATAPHPHKASSFGTTGGKGSSRRRAMRQAKRRR